MGTLEEAVERANRLLETGAVDAALDALAEVGELATDLQEWPTAIRAHRITAELLHNAGHLGPALSHAAEAVYLSLEHRPEEVLDSLGQVLAFVEQAVAARRYYVAEEVGPGMLHVLSTLRPAPGAEGWLTLAMDMARIIALVGEAHGDAHHPAFAEAAALASLVDRATEGRLRLNVWVHSTVFPTGRKESPEEAPPDV